MKKFILKVCGITALGIIGFALLLFTAFMIFSPATLADIAGGLGDDGNACALMYNQYNKSGDIKDLDAACLYALKTEDKALAVKYLGELCSKEDFFNYCAATEDKGEDYYDFICGKYVSALFVSDAFAALEQADALTKEYTAGCALRALAFSAVGASDSVTAASVKDKLAARLDSATSAEKTLIEQDIGRLTEFVG